MILRRKAKLIISTSLLEGRTNLCLGRFETKVFQRSQNDSIAGKIQIYFSVLNQNFSKMKNNEMNYVGSVLNFHAKRNWKKSPIKQIS